MNVDAVRTAIIARVQDDTGSGGLWASGAKLINAVQYSIPGRNNAGLEVALPYVTFDFVAREQNDGFNYDLVEHVFRFHVWDSMAARPTPSRCESIMSRLLGNAIANSDRVPTYGFHRHHLSLTSTGLPGAPWDPSLCYRIGGNEAHEDGVWHFIETYRVNLTRVFVPLP